MADDEHIVLGPHNAGMTHAEVLAVPSVMTCRSLDAQQRIEYWSGMLAYIRGMAEASIGDKCARAVFQRMAGIKATEREATH